jgi:hypothetical protein
MVTFKPWERKMAKGLQSNEKIMPVHQMRILKLWKKERTTKKTM